MSAHSVAPGAQQKRFAAYLNRLAQAAGHLDRVVPLKSYCTGLLLPGERKSVEPMAARLCPDKVRQTHQSLHHVVAHAPWRDEDILEAVRRYAHPGSSASRFEDVARAERGCTRRSAYLPERERHADAARELAAQAGQASGERAQDFRPG